MQRVVIVRSNPSHSDSRVMKESRSLSLNYEVTILGWDRERKNKRSEFVSDHIFIKRCPLNAPYGSFLILLYYPIFWFWVIINIAIIKPEVVHACDFDSLIPAKIYRFFKSTRIVYDNFDKFAMAFIPYSKRFLYNIIDWLEDVLAFKTDLLILVSLNRLRTFRWIPSNVIFVLNCPEDLRSHQTAISQKGDQNQEFIIVYAGVISEDRGLFLLDQVVRTMNNIRFQIAGRPVSKRVFKQLLSNPQVEYMGVLSTDEAIELQAKADIIPLLYNPKIPINRVASPNKLFEAMMLGKPVLSNVCKEIVENNQCGRIVEFKSESIRNALSILMQSQKTRVEMGLNGRKAFEKQYNWNTMEGRLLQSYQFLLHENGGVKN